MSKKKGKKQKKSKPSAWDSDLVISKGNICPHVKRETPQIVVPYELWDKIMGLTREIDTEWMGYLGASKLQTGEWKITGITVPRQEVSLASFKPIDTIPAEGVVHSHVDMTCSFSDTDDAYINSNHDFSIVVNKRAESKAVVRIKLPCGALTVVEAELFVEYPAINDMAAFIEQAKGNIEEEKTKPYKYCGVPPANKKGINNKENYKGWDYGNWWDNY